jgi:hypothetical protein
MSTRGGSAFGRNNEFRNKENFKIINQYSPPSDTGTSIAALVLAPDGDMRLKYPIQL